ncbi:MAG: hypothetical protein M3282_07320 [Gemmatimonadota bacterium]|nr:hypothetical protein [Gemmatimonadota bacterium]
MRRTHPFLLIATLSVVSASLGCAGTRQPVAPPSSPGVAVEDDGREGATLEVDNSSIFDVRMFVVRGSHHVRLGLVTSGTTVEFPIPATMLGRDLVFYAEPVGSSARQRTDAVYVRPGQQVKLGLEKRLRSYSIAIH